MVPDRLKQPPFSAQNLIGGRTLSYGYLLLAVHARQPFATKAYIMLRSCFFSVGLFVALWGISLLFIDKIILTSSKEGEPENAVSAMVSTVTPDNKKVVDPPDWAAFSMMSIGAVTMLYAVALPKKNG